MNIKTRSINKLMCRRRTSSLTKIRDLKNEFNSGSPSKWMRTAVSIDSHAIFTFSSLASNFSPTSIENTEPKSDGNSIFLQKEFKSVILERLPFTEIPSSIFFNFPTEKSNKILLFLFFGRWRGGGSKSRKINLFRKFVQTS